MCREGTLLYSAVDGTTGHTRALFDKRESKNGLIHGNTLSVFVGHVPPLLEDIWEKEGFPENLYNPITLVVAHPFSQRGWQPWTLPARGPAMG